METNSIYWVKVTVLPLHLLAEDLLKEIRKVVAWSCFRKFVRQIDIKEWEGILILEREEHERRMVMMTDKKHVNKLLYKTLLILLDW